MKLKRQMKPTAINNLFIRGEITDNKNIRVFVAEIHPTTVNQNSYLSPNKKQASPN